MIRTIKLANLLSFGQNETEFELRPLNILIGPNGSGKSNFLEVMRLLQAAPRDFSKPFKGTVGGGVEQWIWKGGAHRINEAVLAITIDGVANNPVHHRISFTENSRRLHITGESIMDGQDSNAGPGNLPFYLLENGHPRIALRDGEGKLIHRDLHLPDINPEQSILSQRKDPDLYPELYSLSEYYDRFRIYTDWSFGRSSAQRIPQAADGRTDFLSEYADNLGLILNALRRAPAAKRRILEALEHLIEGIEDFEISTESNTVQVFIQEGSKVFPSTRLSDGTMRFLCLLAILCHPTPPPLICIEEPELGLHPDVLSEVAVLLREASKRTQLIVTTHSPTLIDSFSEEPECVVVCEKHDGGTTMKRLEGGELEVWVKDFSLGKLWRAGEVGGNRW